MTGKGLGPALLTSTQFVGRARVLFPSLNRGMLAGSELDLDFSLSAVASERDSRILQYDSVHGHFPHPAIHPVGVAHLDGPRGLAPPVLDRELLPVPGDARIDHEGVALEPEAEDRLESDAVHPARGTGVPRPPAASDVP